MFPIGDFSLLARVPRRALEAWQAYGLLRPALDEGSGDERYSAALLPRVNRIVVLRELGFQLRDIMRMVDDVSAAELRGMLLIRRCAADRLGAGEEAAEQLLRLRLIETRIAELDDQQPLRSEEIQLRPEPAQLLLCTRATVTSFAKLRSLLRRVADGAYRCVPAQVRGKFMVILHAREFELERLEVQIGFVMQQPFAAVVPLPDGCELRIEELPSVALLASYARTGPAEHAHLATARLARFIEAHDYRLAGPGREVFCERALLGVQEQMRVEMQFPIARVPQPCEVQPNAQLHEPV